MSGQQPNTELANFLRTRRARLTPEQVGLVGRGPQQRRVPGLRRAEVAELAGVSVDYYVRLERGRGANISEDVLSAIARALDLDETERTYLVTIARPVRTRARAGRLPQQQVRPQLHLILQTLSTVPALVLGPRLEVLASNELARALYTDFQTLPAGERNMARFIFLDEAARSFYVDWPAAARGIVSTLHLYAGAHPQDRGLAELVGELSVRDQDFRRWWAAHDVYERSHGSKNYLHPVVGPLTLGYEAFTPTGNADQRLGIHTAEPGSPSADALRLLASWTMTVAG